MQFISGFFNRIQTVILRMGTDEWAIIGLSMVVIAFISMQGFGKNARI